MKPHISQRLTDYIGRQDCRKPSLDALFGHRDRSPQSGVVGEILCVGRMRVHEAQLALPDGLWLYSV